MDQPWSTDKLQKILSNDSIPLNVRNASGDCSMIYTCRICGGCSKLRHFCDTHVWDGAEKRYDQLLYEVFAIRPNPSEMLCQCCIHQLRNVQRFRALVWTAFAKSPTEKMSRHSKIGKCEGIRRKSKRKVSNELLKKATKTIIDKDNLKKRQPRKSHYSNTNVQVKRTNIACASCKQKYPMIVPFEGWKNFVCSRCKKNNGPRNNLFRKSTNVTDPMIAMKEHNVLHANIVERGKSRILSLDRLTRKLSKPLKKDSSAGDSKHYIDNRLQRFSSLYLTKRKSSTQESNISYVCDICGKENIKTRDLFNKHMRVHSETIYRCDVCARVFKDKSAFQIHYLTHGK